MSLLNNVSRDLRARLVGIYSFLLVFNVGAWLWAVLAFRHYPVLLGTAFLAYSFGLRHAVDADHIAAIDNVTRKLLQETKQSVSVGLWFSFGHSTVVFVGSAIFASATLTLQGHFETLRSIGGVVGTLISTVFLFAIAVANLHILRGVWQIFQRVRDGGDYVEEDLNPLLAGRGFLARLLRPMFAIIERSWHMYPLGILFGLGFDTATEIGLLSISATEASKGLSLTSTLIFPTLFAAGMSLIDTTDNVLMLGAYGWAFVKPIRKLYYNLTITSVSIVVALVVGTVEVLGLFATQFRCSGIFWEAVRTLNNHFGALGYFIVGLFAVTWVVSIGFYKWRGLDALDGSRDVEMQA